MASLYSGEPERLGSAGRLDQSSRTAPEYPESEVGDANPTGVGSGSGGVFRQDQRARVIGHKFDQPKSKLFRYDVVHGRGGNVQFAVSRDDRMSPEEAGEKLHQLHCFFGIDGESDAILYGFDRALMFCHTLNSGSTLVPGRSTFVLPTHNASFEFGKVREFLDVDMRRFFRAFADFTTEVNKQVLEAYAKDPSSESNEENFGQLKAVAADRNLHRYPYLAHDSADACLKLNLSERLAVNASKAAVIAATPNAVDGAKPKNNYKSAEGLDSTTGRIY